MLHGLGRDFALALRRLLATPLFAAFAVLSLAVGVGVTTAVYSVVESIFWKDTGIVDPRTLVFVTAPDDARQRAARLSRPDYIDLLAAQKSFVAFGAAQQVQVAAALPSKTELLAAEAVSGDYFRTLGVRASSGRLIEPRDDEAAAPVVVLSEAMWRKRFNADGQIIGRSLRLSGQAFEIIGIAQKPFQGTDARGPFSTGLWVPLATAASLAPRRDPGPGRAQPVISARDRRSLVVAGRLRSRHR